MSNLVFEVLEAGAEAHAAVPTITLRVGVTDTAGRTVHALILRCQIRIEPQRRRYQCGEEERLYDLVFDPLEHNNLAADGSLASTLNDLRGRMDTWMKATSDPLLKGPVPLPPGALANDVDGTSPTERPTA